ncbi:MAG: Nif11-like leader peptide family natural product precursor [Synechococcaceae cyanobacterium]|nr:Nif11-like leader peptide family natural product precursor [Synechococcaceae cyanobacterium]
MSWSELERLVDTAEADGALRRALRHCRSRQELVLAAQRLGYGIAEADLLQARQLQDHEAA